MAARDVDLIPVEVAFALPGVQFLLALSVPEGTTVAEAVSISGIADLVREHLSPDGPGWHEDYGLYGKPVAATTRVCAGDRVELYRPLRIDPKARRRLRAQAAGKSPSGVCGA